MRIINSFKKIINQESGFTLFEVLIGIAISSLIMIMIYTAHNSITKSIRQLTGVADFYENVNLVERRIDRDLSCMYFNKENKKICFIAESNNDAPFRGKMNFVTTEHQEFSILGNSKIPYPKSDIKEIGYYLKQDPKIADLNFLARREERHYDDNPESGGESNIILQNVIDIKFEFRKGNTWVRQWDSRENYAFPKIIKTTLKIRNYNKQEEEFVIISRANLAK